MPSASLHTVNFTTGPIVKPLLRFSLPLLIGNILQQIYQITDSIIVGNVLGKQALAAIGATAPITNLSISFAIGITLGVSVVIAQFFGASDTKSIKQTIATSYCFFLPYALIITCLGFILSEQFLVLTNTPVEIIPRATLYLKITFLGSILMIGYNVSNAIFRGLGNSKKPLLLLSLSIVLNIFLDLLFLLVFKTEVWGTALATILSQGVAFVLSFYYFHKDYKRYHSNLSISLFRKHLLKRLLKIGVPSGFKGSFYWAGFVFITAIINSFGTTYIAAYSIAARIDAFVQLPIITLSHSLSTFVGQNVGAHDTHRIRSGTRLSSVIGLSYAIIMTILVFFFGEIGMYVFTDEIEVIQAGVQYLRYVSIFYIIFSLQEVVQGVAIGSGNTLILLISTIVAMWVVRVPLAFFLSRSLGPVGVWLSIPSGWVVAMCFTNGYYLSGHWKKS